MMNQCRAGTHHCAVLSVCWGYLCSQRLGSLELAISILQSAKCWSVTEAREEERIYLLVCKIYAHRERETESSYCSVRTDTAIPI